MQTVSSHHQFLLPNPVSATLIAEVHGCSIHRGAEIWGRCCPDDHLLGTYSVAGTVSRSLYTFSPLLSQQLLGLDIISVLVLTERLSNSLQSTWLPAGPGWSATCRMETRCPGTMLSSYDVSLANFKDVGLWCRWTKRGRFKSSRLDSFRRANRRPSTISGDLEKAKTLKSETWVQYRLWCLELCGHRQGIHPQPVPQPSTRNINNSNSHYYFFFQQISLLNLLLVLSSLFLG